MVTEVRRSRCRYEGQYTTDGGEEWEKRQVPEISVEKMFVSGCQASQFTVHGTLPHQSPHAAPPHPHFITFSPHPPPSLSTMPIDDLFSGKSGYLEALLLPRERPSYDKNITLAPDDPTSCHICYRALRTSQTPPKRNKPKGKLSKDEAAPCPAIRLQPCGHVIGKPCFEHWYSAHPGKPMRCLECTQTVGKKEDGKFVGSLRKCLRSKGARVVEKVAAFGVGVQIVIVFAVVVFGVVEPYRGVKRLWGKMRGSKKEKEVVVVEGARGRPELRRARTL
jgi:hypothetical protein